jgi:aldose 1-epimerase
MSRVQAFGTAPDGTPVHRVAIGGGELTVHLLTYGATVQDLRLDGVPHPLVLGSDTLAAYLGPMRYFGAIVGRVANRIARGRASLDGQALTLERNENGRTTLHGGTDGSGCVTWRLDGHDDSACRMSVRLPDGQAGFPGNLDIRAAFRTPGDGCLEIDLSATTDASTFCNLAHHGYWCLDGGPDLSRHRLSVAAERYLPVNGDLIPDGAPADVAVTDFDFREPTALIRPNLRLDHNFCLDGSGLRRVATLETDSVTLTVETTAPGLQVYDAGAMNTAPFAGLGGSPYGPYAGVALEPQGWPDAPNNPHAPSVRLDPGQVYRQRTLFRLAR